MVRAKIKPIQGDIFRYLITDGKDNSGRSIYGYGRVLTELYCAFYSNSSLRFLKPGEFAKVEDILLLDVSFVAPCTYDGYEDGTYEVLENIPLERKFKTPIYFYHRAVGENICKVFNIWDSDLKEDINIQEISPIIEQWASYSHIHILKRLGIYKKT